MYVHLKTNTKILIYLKLNDTLKIQFVLGKQLSKFKFKNIRILRNHLFTPLMFILILLSLIFLNFHCSSFYEEGKTVRKTGNSQWPKETLRF